MTEASKPAAAIWNAARIYESIFGKSSLLQSPPTDREAQEGVGSE